MRIAVAVLVSIMAAAAPAAAAPKPEPIRLGAIYNLSGAQAGLDRPSAHGAELAAAEVNRRGGVRGRRLELVVADGRSQPEEIRRQAKKLLKGGARALLGLSDTDMVLPAAEEAAHAHRVFLTSGATSPRLPVQVPTYLFLACFADNVQAAAAAQFAREHLAAQRAARVVDGGMEFATLLGGYFKTAFEKAGGRVPITLQFAHGSADVAQTLRHSIGKVTPPDLLYLAAGPAEAPGLVANLRGAGFGQPIFGGDSFDTTALTAAASGDARVYFTTHAFIEADASDLRVHDFIAAYRSRFREPPDAFSALGYDAVGLLADAIERAESDDPAAVLAALEATRDYEGITGRISYGPDQRIPRKPVYVIEVANKHRSLAATVVPTDVPAVVMPRVPLVRPAP